MVLRTRHPTKKEAGDGGPSLLPFATTQETRENNGKEAANKSRRRPLFRQQTVIGPRLVFLLAILCIILVLLYFVATQRKTSLDRPNKPVSFPGNLKNDPEAASVADSSSSNSSAPQRCRFDGQCPTGTTCAVPPHRRNHLLPGTCQPFPVVDDHDNDAEQRASDACFQACRTELELDEHFYYGAWPEIVQHRRTANLGRSAGCVLWFRRTQPERRDKVAYWKAFHEADRRTPEDEAPPSMQKWDATRHRHVVRVDPAQQPRNSAFSDETEDMWVAYCTEPCQEDADCATQRDEFALQNPFVCDEGACQRKFAFWEPKQEHATLVTAATADFLSGLENFLGSARFWAPHNKVVVYHLGGLNAAELARIGNYSNVEAVRWLDGIPSHYPAHVHEGAVYAWKPIIIEETLNEYGFIFWLDAGSTFAGPLDPLEDIIKRNGIFLVQGQDADMTKLSHDATYAWFGVNKQDYVGKPHYAGGVQGHMKESRFVQPVVACNVACALDAACVAPEGSNLDNHRYDQTSLSLCAYQPKVQPPPHSEYVASNKGQVSGLPYQANFRFIYTSRQRCNSYADIEGTFWD